MLTFVHLHFIDANLVIKLEHTMRRADINIHANVVRKAFRLIAQTPNLECVIFDEIFMTRPGYMHEEP